MTVPALIPKLDPAHRVWEIHEPLGSVIDPVSISCESFVRIQAPLFSIPSLLELRLNEHKGRGLNQGVITEKEGESLETKQLQTTMWDLQIQWITVNNSR